MNCYIRTLIFNIMARIWPLSRLTHGSCFSTKILLRFKVRTSRTLQIEFKELKSRYWGQHLWASGYFCRNVGTITNKVIRDYLENQEDESVNNFKIVG